MMASKEAIWAAAKAIDSSGFCHPHPTWKPAPHLIEKWKEQAIVKARAALDAAAAIDGGPVNIRTVTAYESGFEAEKDAAAVDGDAQLVAAAKAWFEMQSCTNTTSLYNACAKRFGSTFNPTEYDDVS